MVLAEGFTPPLPSSINGSPISSPVTPRNQRQRDMPQHHHNARKKQRFFRAQHAVGEPRAKDGGQIHAAAIRAHNAACHGFIYAQAAFGQLVVKDTASKCLANR